MRSSGATHLIIADQIDRVVALELVGIAGRMHSKIKTYSKA